MRLKKLVFFVFFITLAPLGQAAYIANRDFLSVGQGARANAMGETFVAVADDNSAMFWNPAGLTQLRQDELSTSYANRFDGLSSEAQFHYAWRTRKAMWGAAYVGSYVMDVPLTQSLTQSDLDAIQTGSFAAPPTSKKSLLDHAVLLAYSRPIRPESRHSLGATVKLIYRDFLGAVRGYGTAVDLGYHYITASQNLRWGFNLQNMASLTSYSGKISNLGVRATATESYVPLIRAGFAYTPPWRLLNGRLLLAFDSNLLTSFHVEDYSTGLEYGFGGLVFLRAGKIFGRQTDSSKDYSLGVGVRLKSLSFDFSFLSHELGETSRGTISYRLGKDYYKPSQY